LAKPNYQFEKRQRDLEKKKKKDEKAQRKLSKTPDSPSEEDQVADTNPSTDSATE
jgi:hypothetical protein